MPVILWVLLWVGAADASTVCSSLCDYTTIEDAYNAAASSGDTIDVTDTRTYPESFSISKSITIKTSTSTPATWRSDNSRDSILTVTGGETVEIEGFVFEPLVDRGLEVESASTLTLKNIEIDGFSNTGDNGVGMHAIGGSTLIIEDSTFNNLTSGYGGVLYAQGNSVITIDNCMFDGNEATWGGAFLTYDSSLTITNSTFDNHTAVWGGVLAAEDSALVLSGNTFDTSSASQGGGHLAVWSNDATDDALTLTNNVFLNGTASTDGGSLALYEVELSITGGSFTDNTTGRDGGSIFLEDGSSATINGVSFVGNDAGDDGGALDVSWIDSLDMDDGDRAAIRAAVEATDAECILITHGTDGMVATAGALRGIPGKCIVLTGALQPAAFAQTDAIFNVGCAVGAVQSKPDGVYIAMNGQVFDAERVVKNVAANRFESR